MGITKRYFGTSKDGQEVSLYTLSRERLQVDILTYGGAIHRIMAPDRDGKFENVALYHTDLEGYENNPEYFGVLVGRIAGRIAKGEFSLGDKKYSLAKNNGNNHLHGGNEGFSKRIWDAKAVSEEGSDILELSLESPHMEEGFPGNIRLTVRYVLKGDTLTIEYEGTTDRDTILNLTNHSYFNLSGESKEDIFSHRLFVDSIRYVEVDGECMPGEIREVFGTPFDFTQERVIEYPHYDNPFILGEEKRVIYSHPGSGRVLEISTDQPAVVIYAGWFLPERNAGLAMETQDFPNAVNDERFETEIYTPERPYIQKTSYRFYSR